jgi:hypothetical protein
LQERDELVGRPVSAGGGRGRCGPVERFLFEFKIGFEVNPCGGNVFESLSAHTVQTYLHADMDLKERALARTKPGDAAPGRHHPPDSLLAFLTNL